VTHVFVGNADKLVLPDVGRHRAGPGRLRGIRLVHTHLKGEGLTRDDLTDLTLLSLDLVCAITMDDEGRPDLVHCAHVLPTNAAGELWRVLAPVKIHHFDLPLDDVIRSLEGELARTFSAREVSGFSERAVVVHLDGGTEQSDADLAELLELCRSAQVQVVEVVSQARKKPDPRFHIGKGKLDELVLKSMQLGVDLAIFSGDLTPTQARAITDTCELKVLDRTQLILDIFAQRAKSRDGKLQVELAQLQYMLPRLAGKNTGMSRLTGGIGGRGPGETKLEIDRRRVKDRVRLLERQLDDLCKKRAVQRQQRQRGNVPVVSIVGYTNAGKSTLLNTLTDSEVTAEDKLFATLDPTTRRLRFPEEREIILTDTVGFIRDLPPSLMQAFKATLEELDYADLLLHVADASNPRIEDQIESVERILTELELQRTPRILVLNKVDAADPIAVDRLQRLHRGVAISALDKATLTPLVDRIGDHLWRHDFHVAAPIAPSSDTYGLHR
jgi:GTP-binding protein HflX